MPILRYIPVSAIFIALLMGQGSFVNCVQAFPALANDIAVEDGAKVTALFEITPRDNLTTTYSDIEQFVQGQHIIPPVFEERMAGMRPGEVKTFPLSAEEGYGPYDQTKIQTIPRSALPHKAREGDTIVDDTARTARIVRILPEKAVIDYNHPLAGKPLIVTLQIVTVENPN